MQPRITTRNSVRALPQRQETVLAEFSPRLRSKDAADECLRFLDRVTRGCCKIKSGVSSTLVACERIQHRRKHLTASDKVIVWVQRGIEAGWFNHLVRLTEPPAVRSEEHTSELQSLMRISSAVFCLKKQTSALTSHRTLLMQHASIT